MILAVIQLPLQRFPLSSEYTTSSHYHAFPPCHAEHLPTLAKNPRSFCQDVASDLSCWAERNIFGGFSCSRAGEKILHFVQDDKGGAGGQGGGRRTRGRTRWQGWGCWKEKSGRFLALICPKNIKTAQNCQWKEKMRLFLPFTIHYARFFVKA